MVNLTSPGLLGAVVFARHGDRIESFSSPTSYATFNTFITPLGTHDAFQSGTYLRSRYLHPHSPNLIPELAPTLANIHQILLRADSSGDGTVFQQSVGAVVQGFYPPTDEYRIVLANGTVVEGALGGFQNVPMDAVDMNEDISMNGLLSCPNFDAHVAALEQSPPFLEKGKEAAPFLQKLQPFLGGRPIDFSLMFNIWDYVDVQRQHNSTYLKEIPAGYVNQARVLADFHDANAYSDPRPDGIGNVGTRVMLPAIFTALTRIANASDPLKIAINGISYKPFISLFNLTDATVGSPDVAGIENYNSLAALELHLAHDSAEPTVRLQFKNGTAQPEFRTLTMWGGRTEVPLGEFIARLTPAAINSTSEWCVACNQTSLRGCGQAN
ncbi:phosphoglycerate mutase-like protein [Roridomyces roridus]|uniref:Phosphoglycerate mutase-like protein n=1 Tax=Roridomyces roridus TaxID=1738132 RepID=A0AAD7FK00_9AGAR|nr:phosphoglycerate mutase-like protein [Roridomyces roridus]